MTKIIERHIVLVCPDVHWNTGNIGRTCLGGGARLHLVRPLGFSIDSRKVKRAGLDYWHKVDLSVWNSFEEFIQKMAPRHGEVILLTKTGDRHFWSMPFSTRQFLVFGSETKGLPEDILTRYPAATYLIPISREIRSLNLSTAVGIVLYESLRSVKPDHGWS